jgi:hypothetical protein
VVISGFLVRGRHGFLVGLDGLRIGGVFGWRLGMGLLNGQFPRL